MNHVAARLFVFPVRSAEIDGKYYDLGFHNAQDAVLLSGNRYYVGYNANYRQLQVLGIFGSPFSDAPPMNQQDNYLTITGLN